MANVHGIFTLPTKKENGKPLSPSEIGYVQILISTDQGENFAEIVQVVPPLVEFRQTELEPGTYVFRAIVWDKQRVSKHSSAVDASVDIEDAAPLSVTDFVVVVE